MPTQSIYPTTSSLQYQSSSSSPSSHPSLQLRQTPQKMSITQTFYLAHKARGKLSSEAARSDHNLRLLVGHANLLDTLMIHLSEAERDQENWYNNMVRGNEEQRESVQQWPETISEETEEYGSLAADYESDSESSEEEDEDEEMMDLDMDYDRTLAREPSQPPVYSKYYQTHGTIIGVSEVGEDDYEEDEDECDEDGMFSLTRTTSHRPPSLCSDVSDDEEEDSNPPSPPQPTMSHPPLSHKEQEQARAFFEHNDTPGLSEERGSLFEHDYFVPDRSSPAMISTF